MDEYESLTVWYKSSTASVSLSFSTASVSFEECKATINPNGVLMVMAGKEWHVWNATAWTYIEAVPLVRV